jgi:hypothetical protein
MSNHEIIIKESHVDPREILQAIKKKYPDLRKIHIFSQQFACKPILNHLLEFYAHL